MEEEIKISAYDVANEIQANIIAEADAVQKYINLLNHLAKTTDIEEDTKKEQAGVICEIIADELNHQLKLQGLFTQLTSIKTKADWIWLKN